MYEVDDAPLRITPNGSHSGMDITIQNQGPAAVYLGVDNTLTNTNYGYKIAVSQAFSVELPGNDALYVYATGAGATISTLQLSLEQGA